MDDRGPVGGGVDEASGTGRRDLMKKAAIGGAVLWVAPVVLSAPVAAASTQIHEEDWSDVPHPPQIQTFVNTDIAPTDWDATNSVDVVGAGYATAAAWTLNRAWVDLVGSGNLSGSISYSIAVPDGNYRIHFQYGRYYAGDNSSTISVTVNGAPPPVGGNPLPLLAPQATPQVFNQIFAVTGGTLNLVITGTPHIANVGPAVGTAWISSIT